MPHPPFQNSIGTPFVELQSVDSTNNYALAQIHAGLARHGACFFTYEQVAGRGQRGKTWTAGKNSSLITTVIIAPHPLTLTNQFQLSACVAMSACELLNQYAGSGIYIKWPNDLYWHDRKAGGILIENLIGGNSMVDDGSQSSEWKWAVIGTGINLNQESFPDQLLNPVSLRQITGKEFNPLDMAKEFLSVLDRNWNTLINEGFGTINDYYQAHLYKKDQPVRFKKGSRIFEATIKKVSPMGRLVVQHAMEEEFTSGDLEWILPGPPPLPVA